MQKIYYASGFVIVSDTVSYAVLEYAQALADVGKSDLVHVPSMSDEGLRGQTRLLLGPASQLFAAPALDRGLDLEDDNAVLALREKTARLGPRRARAQHALENDDGGTLDAESFDVDN
jgi:hypothetical protein